MKKSVFCTFVLVFSFFLFGCNTEDPTPELRDKIFKDLTAELEIARKNTQTEVSQRARVSAELKTAFPQTGQHSIHQKRFFESQNQLSVYLQHEKYFEVKLEQRRIYVRKRYLEGLLPWGRKWPAPEEDAEYELRLKLRRAKLDWDKKNVPRGTASDEKSGAKPSAKPKGH